MIAIEVPGRGVDGAPGSPAQGPHPGLATTSFARVLGVDASLTSTGLCVHHPDGRMATDNITSKGRRDDTLADRRARLRTIVAEVRHWIGNDDLVVIEGPSFASAGGSSVDRSGLWWFLVDMAMGYNAVAVVPPATRAKWAAGSGRADKAAVAAAMMRRVPELELSNSDEADAAALAFMGAQWLGWRPVKTKVEQASLDAVRWPA